MKERYHICPAVKNCSISFEKFISEENCIDILETRFYIPSIKISLCTHFVCEIRNVWKPVKRQGMLV